MKIGKVNWDQCFLALIEMGSSWELLDALDPYYDGLNKEKYALEQYNEEYKKAVKSVSHLENKSSLSEDEWNEWEGTVGWYETLGERIGFREESLATGLIIAVWKLVNHLAITASKGLSNRNVSSQPSKFTIFKLGPKIKNEYWAHCINAASNYVRHSSDWNKNLSGLRRNDTNWKNNISSKYKKEKENLKILENIGLEIDLLLSPNDQSYKMAKTLGLLSKSEMRNQFLGWSQEVHSFSKNALGL